MVFAYDNQFMFLVISSTFFRVHAYRVNDVKFFQKLLNDLSLTGALRHVSLAASHH